MSDLWTALCLVAVLEGLVLFAFPDAFKRMAEQMRAMESRQLRVAGAIVLVAGLVALYLGRGIASWSSSPRRRGSMDAGFGRGEELAAEAAPTTAGMPAGATKPRACVRRWPAGSETRIMHTSPTGRFSREPAAGFFRVWASTDPGGRRCTTSQPAPSHGAGSGGARRGVGRR